MVESDVKQGMQHLSYNLASKWQHMPPFLPFFSICFISLVYEANFVLMEFLHFAFRSQLDTVYDGTLLSLS